MDKKSREDFDRQAAEILHEVFLVLVFLIVAGLGIALAYWLAHRT